MTEIRGFVLDNDMVRDDGTTIKSGAYLYPVMGTGNGVTQQFEFMFEFWKDKNTFLRAKQGLVPTQPIDTFMLNINDFDYFKAKFAEIVDVLGSWLATNNPSNGAGIDFTDFTQEAEGRGIPLTIPEE